MSDTKQCPISPIAAAVSAALVTPAAALAQEEGARAVLEEIIVTARKREENVQRIPASVQAIPEEMLKDMGALNTEDFARFIPSMTYLSWSTAGSNQIIFRGVNTGTSNFIAAASASTYLDEISLTQTGSQPNVRMMDIARVEALAGPQGTLYGAAAQSGTLRIHTNQPDASKFESSVDASFRSGDTSDPSYSVTGVLNIPIVEDVFAIRLAAQTAEDGGFVDNVLGHTPDTHWGYAINYGSRSEWGTLDNSDVAEKNWNSVEFTAARISALWNINDNWSATLTYNYSDNEAQGDNYYNPFVGDLQTINFAKNWRRDKWDVLALTVEADLGFAQFVSATSFFDRTYEYSVDGTMYHKYYTAWGCEERPYYDMSLFPTYYYWLWPNPATGVGWYYPQYCIMPGDPTVTPWSMGDANAILEGPEANDKFAQEFRFSHQGETIDWLFGLYYEESTDDWDSIWARSTTGDYQDTVSLAYFETVGDQSTWGCRACYGEEFPLATGAYLSTDRTEWKQKAVFGELTWHINEQWHATVGGRWFETTNDKLYLTYHTSWTTGRDTRVGGHRQPRSDVGSGGDEVAHGKLSEFVPKFSVAWNISDSKMLYALYTEGFRPGGINRSNGNADWSRTVFPQAFEPDVVANTEIGAKMRFANNRVQLNVAYFDMQWDDMQLELVDPSGDFCRDPSETPGNCSTGTLPWLKNVGNVGAAHTSGVNLEFAWIPADGWDIGANAQWLEAEIDEDYEIDPDDGIFIFKGMELPNVPDFQGSMWATYSWPVQFVRGGEMFIRGQYSHTGKSVSKLIPAGEDTISPSFTNDDYAIGDIRVGLISHDGDWQLDLFINNVTDEMPMVYRSDGSLDWQFSSTGEYDHYHAAYTIRPREYGIRFSKSWGE